MMAVAEMREKKGPEEIEELEKSFHIGYAMHTTAMKMCRPGIVEREIVAHVTTSEALGAHDRHVAHKLINLNVPELDRVEFDVE